MFCCGVLPCLGFAQIRADIILISVQEKLTLTKREELISLVLRVVLGAGMQTLVLGLESRHAWGACSEGVLKRQCQALWLDVSLGLGALKRAFFISPASSSECISPCSSPLSGLGQWSQPLVLVVLPGL